ncbi:MAG: CoA transferase [Clostridia bacterium]|nr:MAG: CoA transferase [Clostridia bacterium]
MKSLRGISVLDLSPLIPGPYASLLLASWGAEVIKVEDPRFGDPIRSYPPAYGGFGVAFSTLNKGKRSLAVDLKTSAGREIFYRLAKKADVIIEGFSPGVAGRLKVDYPTVKSINPRVVYCSISSYGQEGPYRDLPGHDLNFVGLGGMLAFAPAGEGTQPVFPISQLADISSGLYAAVSILAALLGRERGGAGTYIDVSMHETVASWWAITQVMSRYTHEPNWGHMMSTGQLASYNVYLAGDGQYLSLGILEDKFWERLCDAMEFVEGKNVEFRDPELQPRLRARLQEIFMTRPRDEWFILLRQAQVPVAPVNDMERALADPQLVSREFFTTIPLPGGEELPALQLPGRLATWQPDPPSPPALGEHTAYILQSLGYGAEEIADLQEKGIVASSDQPIHELLAAPQAGIH